MRQKFSFAHLVLLSLVFLFATFGFQPAKTLSTTVIVPDDFPTIQEAINNAADGDTVFVKAGTYYEHVVVNKTVSLVGEDASTTIIDGNNTGHVLYVISDNVNISGFTVQRSGNVHMPALDAGICLNNTANCDISENRLIDNGFAGISLLYSHQNTIIHNNLSSTGWGGIHLASSSRNIVSGNIITDKYGGVNGHVSSNYNNITENVISNCTYGGFWNAASYNNICGNNISAIEMEGIWLQDQVSHNTVAENNLINNTVAIRVQGPNTNNTLLRNVLSGAEYGIKIQSYAAYTRIANNTIVNNRAGNDSWSAGIRLDQASDSQIYSNIISGNRYGILLYSSSPRVSVYGNNITGNEFGLRVASGGSGYLNMTRNVVADNVGYGIGLTGFASSSNYAVLTNNTIVNNGQGVSIGQYSNFNTVSQNYITQNNCGLYLEYSIGNLVYGNSLVRNDQQVSIQSGSVNNWNGSYPAGGNYWSDYASPDLLRGLYQNVTGGDGIGDNPYVIDDSNRDNYPFMLLSVCNVSQVPSENNVLSTDIVEVNATVTHCFLLEQVTLNCTYTNSSATWTESINMTNLEDDIWNGIIPALPVGTNVTYVIVARDNAGNSINSTSQGYTFEYPVVIEFPTFLILPLLMIASLLAVIFCKRKSSDLFSARAHKNRHSRP
jgi:parallel beta-helix repeat protein